MITYHPRMKNIHNLQIVIFEVLKTSKYFKMVKFQYSLAKFKWVIMCMAYEQSFYL
jgi:hypothetical protein